MTTIMIGKALATVMEADILTSGMVNAKVKFEFSADWTSSLSKTAIFTAGDVTKAVLETYWENNVCSIPQECLETSGEILMVGVYGADNANKVAIPTVWATVGKIRKGYEGYEDVSTGTLPIWAQVQSAAAQAAAAAEDAQSKAEDAQGKAEDAQKAASEIASAVEKSVTSAENYSKVAESWAVGGTGVRTGEDTNNAKHWAQTAQVTADSFSATSVEDDGNGNITIENYNVAGDVTSFNGRVGAVEPVAGDYTAGMVGADAEGAADAVQGNLDTHAENSIMHVTAAEREAWNAKQSALTFDTTPTSGSTNPVTSGGVKTAISPLTPIMSASDPTSKTEGAVGQLLSNGDYGLYICQRTSTIHTTSGDIPAYDWYELITGHNIRSVTVHKASYASDTDVYGTIAVGTAALRNQYFVSTEATPTVNGNIAWVYG